MEASDYYHRVWLVNQGRWLFTFDEENVPIQMAGYGMVMAIRRDAPWLLLCNRLHSPLCADMFCLVPQRGS